MKTFTLWFADRINGELCYRYVECHAKSHVEARRIGKADADNVTTWFRGVVPNREQVSA